MQLSRLYSNQERLFTPIDFNCRPDSRLLNVVFAQIKRKKERDGDSHNLGKTTLIHLLDFMLLKDIASTNHFLAKHADRFAAFVFYFEIALREAGFVTVRRSIENPTKIGLKVHDQGKADLRSLPPEEWDHWDVALSPAQGLLDSYLDLRAIAPWDYRKGVSYFLRTQEDYQGIFQIQKFMQGKDREWKPYLAAIFGLDHEAVHQKYVVDDQIDDLTRKREEQKAEIQVGNQERGEVASQIDILRAEIGEIEARLDGFDFTQEERRISKRVVESVESRIADINDEIYDIETDIAQLARSLKTGIKFDLEKLQKIFMESKIAFPDGLSRSYEELVEFNRKLTRERNAALRARIADLEKKRDGLLAEQSEKNEERQQLLRIIRDADTFKKYKALQGLLAEQRAELAYREAQLKKIDSVLEIDRRIRDLRKRRDDQVTAIEISLQRGSGVKTMVTQLFSRYAKAVLNINAEFIVSQNRGGNIEFEVKTKDLVGSDTSQSDGHTYRRLLCALFDIATLKALENSAFYRFVYHDGIFEGLDNRVKVRLLELIRDCISSGRIQYILSTIETDLPRSLLDDSPIAFSGAEIVLTLNDQGDSGRLFKMAPF